MYYFKILLLFLTIVFLTNHGKAQQPETAASLDSTAINEAILVQEEQQKRIDSLVKVQLQRELTTVSGNLKRTAELEARLRKIAVSDSLRTIAQMEKLNAMRKKTVGYPVTLNQDTLFFIYTRAGSFDAKDRAKSNSNKIQKLYKDPFFKADSLMIAENEGSFDIIYNNTEVIMSIGNLDGLWFNKSNAELAKEYLDIIKKSIAKERQANSLINWVKRLGLVLLIIVLLVFIVSVINKWFMRIAEIISANKEQYLQGLRLKNVKLITADHLENALLRLSTAVKVS